MNLLESMTFSVQCENCRSFEVVRAEIKQRVVVEDSKNPYSLLEEALDDRGWQIAANIDGLAVAICPICHDRAIWGKNA